MRLVNSEKSMRNKKHKRRGTGRIRIAYAVFLVLYSLFVILDAFVIPRNIVRMLRGESGIDGGEYEPIVTDSSYDDGNIVIGIRTERIHDTTVYIADVKLRDPALLKTGLAGDSFGRNLAEVTSSIAERSGAVFAINGDYYGFREKGYVMRGGYLYRKTSNTRYPYGEDLVIWEDGSFEIVNEASATAGELADKGAREIFSFGPALVNDGQVQVFAGEEVERAQITNPRTAIGILGPSHYLMVVSDGRTAESRGLSLFQLAELMQEEGCQVAYNLDGGGSSTIWFNGKVLNKPTTYGDVIAERTISDILYVGY